MQPVIHIGERLQQIHEAETPQAKQRILAEGMSDEAFKLFLRYAFHPTARWAYENRQLPRWRPVDNPYGASYMYLRSELRRFHLFLMGVMDPYKLDSLIAEVLENVPVFEANVLSSLIQGNGLGVNGLTREFIDDHFPGILHPLPQKAEEPKKEEPKSKTTKRTSTKTTTKKPTTKKPRTTKKPSSTTKKPRAKRTTKKKEESE